MLHSIELVNSCSLQKSHRLFIGFGRILKLVIGKVGDASHILPVATLCKPNYFGETRNKSMLGEQQIAYYGTYSRSEYLHAVQWLLYSSCIHTKQGKSSESVQLAMLKACDACADMGQ